MKELKTMCRLSDTREERALTPALGKWTGFVIEIAYALMVYSKRWTLLMEKLAELVSFRNLKVLVWSINHKSIFSGQIWADQIKAAQFGAKQNLEVVGCWSGRFLGSRGILLGHASNSSESWRQRDAQHSSRAFDSTRQAGRAVRLILLAFDINCNSFFIFVFAVN